MKIETAAALAALWGFVKGLLPGAFGAAIAVTMDRTATFAQKLLQFVAGIIVSYYVSGAVRELTDFGPMVQQSVSFTLGLIAYNSAKSFMEGSAETARSIPRDVWDWWKGKWDIMFGGTKK